MRRPFINNTQTLPMKRHTTTIFFALITVSLGSSTMQAQTDASDSNSLWRLTGPNVLPARTLQWNNSFEWSFGNLETLNVRDNQLTGSTGLRYGIAGRADLNLAFEGGWVHEYNADNGTTFNTHMLAAVVGAKIGLFEGRNALPQVAFRTDIAFPFRLYGDESIYTLQKIQPSVELDFRNRIGRRWSVDYTVGYAWHEYGYDTFDDGIYYSLSANFMATERLLLGLSFSRQKVRGLAGSDFHLTDTQGLRNHLVNLTALFQATPRLQLSLQGNMQAGGASYDPLNSIRVATELRLGLHWLIGGRR